MSGFDIVFAIYLLYTVLDTAYSIGKRRGFKEAEAIWKPKHLEDLRRKYDQV